MRPPFKIHGGKSYLHAWVLDYFPINYRKLNYVEPFIGAGSVFFNKDSSKTEVISDLNPGTVSIYRELKSNFNDFLSTLKQIPYCNDSFYQALAGQFSKPVNTFIIRRMSRGGLGKDFSGSDRLRGGIPEGQNSWKTILNELHEHSRRLRFTEIREQDAITYDYNDPDTLYYLDPPYVPETRTAKSVYEYEMTFDQHKTLLLKIWDCKSKIVLSGYSHPLYDTYLSKWNKTSKTVPNHSGQTKQKQLREESLWWNF